MRIYKRKGSPNWWASWNDQNGRRHRKSTGTEDKELAQALAAKWRQESFMERHFEVIPETPFRDALLRYAEERQRENPRSYEHMLKYCLQRLLDRYGDDMLTEINAATIRDFATERRKSVKPATVHRDLSVLRAILNRTHQEGLLAMVPPFPTVKQPPGRCRWLTLNEEGRLIGAAANHLCPVIIFALDTGGRRTEVLGLDWRHVDLDNNRVVFVKTKNGEDRYVRLTDRARSVLERLEPKESGPVFTFRGKAIRNVDTSFDRARVMAGLEDVRFHDLRHTFASRLVQKGVPLYEVMQLTGHKSLAMVQRYAHLAPDFQERAIDALNTFGHKMGTATEMPTPEAIGETAPEMAKPPGLPGGFGRREIGAGDEIRTHDFNLGKVALYP